MQANLALRKGLGAVVGLNFDVLAPALQVKMMRPMTITRYKKVRVGFLAGFCVDTISHSYDGGHIYKGYGCRPRLFCCSLIPHTIHPLNVRGEEIL